MNKKIFAVLIILTFVIECVLCVSFLKGSSVTGQDPVKVNRCLKSIEENYGDQSKYDRSLDYALLDADGRVLFKTKGGISENANDAVKRSEAVLPLVIDGTFMGSVIFHGTVDENIASGRRTMTICIIAISAVQCALIVSYYLHIRRTITKPFEKMNDFAVRIAGGNLDVPLTVDRGHVFGSFTEAFDIMRSELKKARMAEKKASDDKKETIAKLSHDIKTPVASIKSTSELGFEMAKDDRSREYFNLINIKSDQIKALTDNLFNSSVSEATEISVDPGYQDSAVLIDMMKSSDYLNKLRNEPQIPQCRVFIDKLRMQQTLDNIFMNSYKYADTPIEAEAYFEEDYLVLKITDEGPGVSDKELPLLKEKYKRGSNTEGKDGAGLGLYITDLFMQRSGGKLVLRNEEKGFSALLYIRADA